VAGYYTRIGLRPFRELDSQLILPGNVQSYVESPVYARTNGYLKKWYKDIGSHVKEGDLLAEIDTR
jgi:multidrug efflux pump subunit AcrA (membrane-fusion protein)